MYDVTRHSRMGRAAAAAAGNKASAASAAASRTRRHYGAGNSIFSGKWLGVTGPGADGFGQFGPAGLGKERANGGGGVSVSPLHRLQAAYAASEVTSK